MHKLVAASQVTFGKVVLSRTEAGALACGVEAGEGGGGAPPRDLGKEVTTQLD